MIRVAWLKYIFQAIFDINFFRENPEPFFKLAKELYPGTFSPTPSHLFIRLLERKGLLLRHYTQNIDTLERVAGISGDKLVEAHGTFHSARCISCGKEYEQSWVKDKIFDDVVPTCEECNGLVKPDIVFFGENLPERFFNLVGWVKLFNRTEKPSSWLKRGNPDWPYGHYWSKGY